MEYPSLYTELKARQEHSGIERNEEMGCKLFEGALDEVKHATGLNHLGVYLSCSLELAGIGPSTLSFRGMNRMSPQG